MEYQDKQLQCRDCQADFAWTAGEQEFYAQKGFTYPPVRCPDCRRKKKDAERQNRGSYEIKCKECGQTDTVNFQPRNPDDVLCGECFRKSRLSQQPVEQPETEQPETTE